MEMDNARASLSPPSVSYLRPKMVNHIFEWKENES